MNHHVDPFRQIKRGCAGRGIAKNRDRFTGRRWGKKIGPAYHAAVFQGDRFACFQILEPGTGLHPSGFQRFGVERAGFIMLLNAVTVTFQRVFKRVSRYFSQPVIKNFPGGDFDDFQRIVSP